MISRGNVYNLLPGKLFVVCITAYKYVEALWFKVFVIGLRLQKNQPCIFVANAVCGVYVVLSN